MKTKLFFLAIVSLLFLQGHTQPRRAEVKWNATYMAGVYSEILEQPLKVTYVIPCTVGTISRKGMDFRTHSRVITSDDADYKNNVWDKGHMAPAAAFNCDSLGLYESFTYLNCALQHERLNRGPWKDLETYERQLAKKDDVTVYVSVEFPRKPMRVPGGAAIPVAFYKEINSNGKKECYRFLNQDPVSKDYRTYKCKCK